MKRYQTPCEDCVFCVKDGYGDNELGMNLFCMHPEYAHRTMMCPTVQSYEIKKNLGLIKEEDR